MALIRGTNLNNVLSGTSFDDMFAGLGGNDWLDGGLGVDTSWYSGLLSGYAFSSVGGRLIVRDILAADGSEGSDSLEQIEKIQFSDLQLTVTGSEFQVNTYFVNAQYAPDIVHLADGGYLVSWTSIGDRKSTRLNSSHRQ